MKVEVNVGTLVGQGRHDMRDNIEVCGRKNGSNKKVFAQKQIFSVMNQESCTDKAHPQRNVLLGDQNEQQQRDANLIFLC
tara:strand:- start:10420 stop:10659 length:240 start_codon:yes stop_codon:yes gene_type:complete